MKVAYLVLAHHKPRQFDWLWRALANPVDLFLVHVDAKTPAPTRAAIGALVAGRANVHLLPPRSITWGGWSLAAVQLDAIRAALELDREWRWFSNLSGQDYPLRSPEAIRAALAAEPDRNHVHGGRIDDYADRAHLRRRRRWLRYEREGRIVGTPFPRLRWHGVRVEWKGSGWWTLTRDFCVWIARDPFARRCAEVLRTTYVPDEFLMQTLGRNSPFADTLTGDDRREAVWDGGPHPVTLTLAHADRLLASRADFARKFDDDVDADILRALARRIGARVPAGD